MIGRIFYQPTSPQTLHFAVAYGAAWETDLNRHPFPLLNAGSTWIRARYMDPNLLENVLDWKADVLKSAL